MGDGTGDEEPGLGDLADEVRGRLARRSRLCDPRSGRGHVMRKGIRTRYDGKEARPSYEMKIDLPDEIDVEEVERELGVDEVRPGDVVDEFELGGRRLYAEAVRVGDGTVELEWHDEGAEEGEDDE